MPASRKKSVLVGVLILLAYCIVGTSNNKAVLTGMLLEISSGLCMIGIALLMFPLLNPYGKGLSVI